MQKFCKTISTIIIAIVVLTVFMPCMNVFATLETNARIVNVNSSVNMRSGPSTKRDLVTTVPLSAQVQIVEEVDSASDDTSGYYTWYHIKVEKDGTVYEGYVASHFIQKDAPVSVPSSDFAFEDSISSFPESYKSYLRELHESHPNWIFHAEYVGESWNAFLNLEAQKGVSLVQNTVDASWISQSFTGVYDSPNWVNASRGIIAYYIDPRNLLTDSAIFQFVDLRNSATGIDNNFISKVLNGTFMEDPKTATFGEETYTYKEIFSLAGNASGINPIFLASHVVQECGTKGSSSSSGASGYYNFYNIGAYSDVIDASRVGLSFAQYGLDEAFNAKYLLPWDSEGASIIGGSMWINDNYVGKGQYTLYYMRFNCSPNRQSSLGKHQYMTALQSATSESKRMYSSYKSSGLLDTALEFYIPVFSDMPEVACDLPTSTTRYDAFIYRVYNALLNRDPGSTELADSRNLLADCSAGTYIASVIRGTDFSSLNLTNEEFIRILYQLILNREADSQGLQNCLNILNNYGSRLSVLETLVNSDEAKRCLGVYSISLAKYEANDITSSFDSLIPLVQSLYRGFLGREADYDGMVNWITVLSNKTMSGPEVAAAFATSQEFMNLNLSNGEFVSVLYRICFNREADSAGFEYWVGALEGYYSREYVIQGFVNSPEYIAIFNSYGVLTRAYVAKNVYSLTANREKIESFVGRLYWLALGREADEEGFRGWSEQLVNHSNTGYGVAYGFIFSTEMKNMGLTNEEMVTRFYQIFLNRDPDPLGFEGWVQKLNDGEDLEKVFEGFVYSPEYVGLCIDAGFYPYNGYQFG